MSAGKPVFCPLCMEVSWDKSTLVNKRGEEVLVCEGCGESIHGSLTSENATAAT